MRAMKSLPRDQLEALVREVESDAYGFALALDLNPAAAGRVLAEAFGDEARLFVTSRNLSELRENLRTRIRVQAGHRSKETMPYGPAPVTPDLHARLVDRVEEQQYVEPTGRRKAVLVGLLAGCVIAALVAVEWIRLDALASAQPTIRDASPAANWVGVPTSGVFMVSFGRYPSGEPRLRVQPADVRLGPVDWNGRTLVVGYLGLHNAAHYQLILDADYTSRFRDTGHYQKRWSFTTEGYPIVATVDPANDATVARRNGQLTITFNHQPSVNPLVSLTPADGTLEPGTWSGATWIVRYSGLKPLASYQAMVTVDYGVAKANIRRSWAFTTEPGIPPAGTPVIWYTSTNPWNSADVPRMVALDWQGQVVGTMYQPVTVQSPDGSIVGTTTGTYLTAAGERLSALSGIPYFPVIADDNASVCELSNTIGGRALDQLWLTTGPVSGPLHAVAPVGGFGARSGVGIIACSALNDRAVIADTGMNGTNGVRVIALSTGRVLYQHAYAVATSTVFSSHDARYLAELMPVAGSEGAPFTTVIRRTADGTVVARLDGRLAMRFSWDDRAVVTTMPLSQPTGRQLQLQEWQTGKVIWRLPTPAGQGEPVFALAQPHGTKIAIASWSQTDTGAPDQLWLVDADGNATQVLSEPFYPVSVSGF